MTAQQIKVKHLKEGAILLNNLDPIRATVESIREDGGERVITFQDGSKKRFHKEQFVEVF